ncbi:hypothetical protein CRENBAI_025504 [Crenichthys baileyi]|uniref:Uncharacterized protein n=1 Tax=Crenichthys baileyi TaxID=28760 RepID=A0AAV9S2Z2_9TELE
MDLADEHQANSMDIFAFLSREAERMLRRSAGLSVPQSVFCGSRLAIPCPGTGPLRRRSTPPLHSAARPTSSSRHKKRWRGAPSCGSAGELAAASIPTSSSATAKFPRLAAAPPMPSSARCSEATPEELEERLRFFARQIKSSRKTSLLYFSSEQMQRIKQMEENYERLFYCRPPSPTPSHMLLLLSSPRHVSRELLQLSPRHVSGELLKLSPRHVSRELLQLSPHHVSKLLLLLQNSPRQVYSLLQSFRRGPWAGCLHFLVVFRRSPRAGCLHFLAMFRRGPRAGCLHDQVLSTSLVSSGGCSRNSGLTHSLTHHSLG